MWDSDRTISSMCAEDYISIGIFCDAQYCHI